MIIIPGKLIYLFHPRTGSQATREALLRVPGAIDHSAHHQYVFNADTELLGGGELVACTVRNHFDAIATWWQYHAAASPNQLPRKKSKTLLQFLDDWKDHPFVCKDRKRGEYCLWGMHRPHADRILRYESIQHDFDSLMKELGIATIKLPTVNETPNKRPYREYYGVSEVKRVEQLFGNEMKELGYTWTN